MQEQTLLLSSMAHGYVQCQDWAIRCSLACRGVAHANLYFQSMSFWQTYAEISQSTGMCVFPGPDCVLEGGRRKRGAILSAGISEQASQQDAKAEQICQIYLDDAIKTLAPQGKPREMSIANARSACVQDVGLTGDEKVKTK